MAGKLRRIRPGCIGYQSRSRTRPQPQPGATLKSPSDVSTCGTQQKKKNKNKKKDGLEKVAQVQADSPFVWKKTRIWESGLEPAAAEECEEADGGAGSSVSVCRRSAESQPCCRPGVLEL